MRLFAWQHIFLLSLLLACGFASASSIVKRADDDESALSKLVDTIINLASKIPLVGGDVAGILKWILKVFNLFEIGTNGFIARLLGGALPCTMALTGISCSGLTDNGGFGALLLSTLDDIPSLLLPGFVKSIIKLIIQFLIDPTVDVLFGGVPVSAT